MTGWLQYDIAPYQPTAARQLTAGELHLALTEATDDGSMSLWWFMHKPVAGPHGTTTRGWRLRFRAVLPDITIAPLLDKLTERGHIAAWRPATYEPETMAFGGTEAMEIGHRLFHLDSRQLWSPRVPTLGSKETAVLLCSALLRAAELDWHEQGDVWDKVAALRRHGYPNAGPPLDQAGHLAAAMTALLTVDTRALTDSGQPLRDHADWVSGFERAGQSLANLSRHGRLHHGIGLRSVLAKHIVFHLNRAGIPGADQTTLTSLAVRAVFPPDHPPVSTPAGVTSTPKVDQMTTLSHEAPMDASALRNALADRLTEHGTVADTGIDDAFRAVPREKFLPGVPVEQAYADDPVYTKADGGGTRISAASKPTVVALMLGQLDARPGEKVLEIGAGTGYNAALLGHLVGPKGCVVTIDVDDDLTTGARAHLAHAGTTNVQVILADGALGHQASAPYDKVIATCSAYDIPTPWLNQLAPGGRLLVPTRLRGAASRTIAFEHQGDEWRSVSSHLSVFMPLRGLGDDARTTIALNSRQDVTLQIHKDQTVEPGLLEGVLDTPSVREWTGVELPPGASFEWMDLWLALALEGSLMRMSVNADAKERHGLTPMFGWGAMATTRGTDLAYLTMRRTPQGDFEVGVSGHGPTAQALVHDVTGQLRVWGAQYRDKSAGFALPDGDPGQTAAAEGRFVLDRPGRPIVVTWQ